MSSEAADIRTARTWLKTRTTRTLDKSCRDAWHWKAVMLNEIGVKVTHDAFLTACREEGVPTDVRGLVGLRWAKGDRGE